MQEEFLVPKSTVKSAKVVAQEQLPKEKGESRAKLSKWGRSLCQQTQYLILQVLPSKF